MAALQYWHLGGHQLGYGLPLRTHRQEFAKRLSCGKRHTKAIDYSLGRSPAPVRFLDDGALPVNNHWVENRIRPITVGRSNWLFAGSLRAGQRAAQVMSLVQSARLNDHNTYQYHKDAAQARRWQLYIANDSGDARRNRAFFDLGASRVRMGND